MRRSRVVYNLAEVLSTLQGHPDIKNNGSKADKWIIIALEALLMAAHHTLEQSDITNSIPPSKDP